MNQLRSFIAGRGQGDPVARAIFALASDSLVYWAGSAMIGVGNFVLVPLYTRYLAPAEFGVYALVDIVVLIFVTVTQLGLGVSYLKWFADMGQSQRGELLGSTLISGAVTAGIGGGLLTLAVASPSGKQWLQTDHRGFAWVLLPMVVLENLQGLLLTDLRARRQAIAFSTSTVARLVGIVLASLWFIIVREQGVIGVFLGRLVGDGVGVLLLAAFCLRSTRLCLVWPTVLPMVRYGLPLVWSSLTAMMLDAAGRYYLSHYSTLVQVGFYGAAIKISGIFQMLVYQPFGVAWGGLMFQIVKWPHARTIYSKVTAYVFVLSLAVALILALFTPALFAAFATAAYVPGMVVFPLILLTRAINTMEYPVAIGIYLAGQTRWFALVYSLGLGVNLLVNYLLVPMYGMFGSTCAWLLSWVVVIGSMGWIGQHYYPLQYNWRLFLLPTIPWVLLLGQQYLTESLPDLHWGLQILLSLLVIVGTGLLLAQDLRLTRRRLSLESASG